MRKYSEMYGRRGGRIERTRRGAAFLIVLEISFVMLRSKKSIPIVGFQGPNNLAKLRELQKKWGNLLFGGKIHMPIQFTILNGFSDVFQLKKIRESQDWGEERNTTEDATFRGRGASGAKYES